MILLLMKNVFLLSNFVRNIKRAEDSFTESNSLVRTKLKGFIRRNPLYSINSFPLESILSITNIKYLFHT